MSSLEIIIKPNLYPMSVEYERGGEVIYSQSVPTPGAYLPPIPDDCTLIVYYSDGTTDVFPPY